jgi:uncharacterized protein
VRAVLDTNVMVSALLTPTGVCGQILNCVTQGALLPCVDARILDEYEQVLARPHFGIDPTTADELLELLALVAEAVTALPLPLLLPDASDQPFLEVAAAADAILVTGNRRHYPGTEEGPAVVMTPRQMLDHLREQTPQSE